MDDLNMKIQLKAALVCDAELIWNMQLKAFKELLEKYQDFDTNPGNDTLEKVISKLKRDDTKYYFIVYKDCCVGVIHIKQIEAGIMNLKTLYVLPEYQGLGIAQKTITLIEKMYPNVKEWRLDTILQENGNCYLYEKMGYLRTGAIRNIKEDMDLVYYKKVMK